MTENNIDSLKAENIPLKTGKCELKLDLTLLVTFWYDDLFLIVNVILNRNSRSIEWKRWIQNWEQHGIY
jgi:hypothetical protein